MSRPTDTRVPGPQVVERERGDDAGQAIAGSEEEAEDEAIEGTTFDAVSAILSSIERGGDWLVSDRTEARALFGELKLDFTRAELPADGVVEIQCTVVCGQLELTVPEGSELELEGLRVIVGELKQGGARKRLRDFVRRMIEGDRVEPNARSAGEPPLFVVTGRVVFGGLNVISR